jgi:hypothetical protein
LTLAELVAGILMAICSYLVACQLLIGSTQILSIYVNFQLFQNQQPVISEFEICTAKFPRSIAHSLWVMTCVIWIISHLFGRQSCNNLLTQNKRNLDFFKSGVCKTPQICI